MRWQAGIGREWTVRLRTGYRGDGGLGGELAEARLVAPERHVKAHWPASAEMRAVARRLKRPVLGARPGGIPDLTPRGGGRRVRHATAATAAGGGGAEPVPLEGGRGERSGLAKAVVGRLVEPGVRPRPPSACPTAKPAAAPSDVPRSRLSAVATYGYTLG